MLFNSYTFIFLFLPTVLLGFHLIGKQGHHRVAIAWLVGASLFFYGWWNPAYLGLMLVSIFFNYGIGVSLGGAPKQPNKKPILIFGVIVNLGLLAYFKYANFFVDNLNNIAGTDIVLEQIILPLAISFFTFQQIAYLVDAWRGETKEYNFLHYCLFVTFFPQLIAGPIVHHKEMLPQFAKDVVYKLRSKHLAIGLTIFAIGLFKKVVLADGISVYASPVFDAAEAGVMLTFFEAWGGSLAWTLQYYFDFSGYSDMAIGLARMFGIRLPLNFNSPYKATSMIDYWRRWHITLSRFLRDYLYFPLGGNRKGPVRQRVNLMITMLLGGLWHGASWTFVIWGGLNGLFLVINAIYRHYRTNKKGLGFFQRIFVGWIVTFLGAVIVRVLFCSTTLDGAWSIFKSMFGLNGFSISERLIGRFGGAEEWLLSHGVVFNGFFQNGVFGSDPYAGVGWIVGLLLISVALPNTQQIMRRYRPAFETYQGEIKRLNYRWLEWRPTKTWGIFTATIFVLAVLGLTRVSEFLYFQF